jgi:predicted Zn-dependent peptidase
MKQAGTISILLNLFMLITSTCALANKTEDISIKGLPAYAPDKPLILPTVVEKKLANGLTLWLIERQGLPLVSMYLAAKGGEASDPENRRGLSNILQATIDAGTKSRDSRQIAEQLQALGADISVGINNDVSYIGINGLSSGADSLLEILADTSRNASFPEHEVKLAVENELQSIIASKSQPSYELSQVFYRRLFGDHPYGFINPDPEVIAKISIADLKQAYQLRFQPDQAILIMVGKLPTKDMEALANKHFSDWKNHGEKLPEIPPARGTAQPALLLVNRPHSVQSTINVGRPMPPAGNADEYALEVTNTIFGGSFGSRLTKNIREDKGYTYSPRAYISSWTEGGSFRISASVRNEVTAATLVEVFYELDKLATTLPKTDEVTHAQRYLKGSFLLSNETSSALAATLTGYWIDGKTPGNLAEYVPGIEKVSRQNIQEMGQKYFGSRKQTVAVSGDANAIRDMLSLFGKVNIVTP